VGGEKGEGRRRRGGERGERREERGEGRGERERGEERRGTNLAHQGKINFGQRIVQHAQTPENLLTINSK
jgi:hypothetical protein